MKVTFRLTRAARSLAGSLSSRKASADAALAIAQFKQAVGASVLVSDPIERSDDETLVTLTALRPEELPQLSEAWQRVLVSHGVQSDAIG